EEVSLETDNKAVKKLLNESLERFQKEIFIRTSCLNCCEKGIGTISYIRAKSAAEVDFRPTSRQKTQDYLQFSKSIIHPDLYTAIKRWRNNLAEEFGIPTYMILPQKSIQELMQKLPTTLPALKGIKGIGQAKIKQYGPDIVRIVKEFCASHEIVAAQFEIPVVAGKEKSIAEPRPAVKKEKTDSPGISYDMFVSGKTVAEIVAERNLQPAPSKVTWPIMSGRENWRSPVLFQLKPCGGSVNS
ncbi:MAG: HRDC domain-containing protein, partial [Bacteroidota bacterium]